MLLTYSYYAFFKAKAKLWLVIISNYSKSDFFIVSILALFRQYSEAIPEGETCKALSEAAKSNKMYIVGGSIPEICDDKVYNTCTVWDPNGNMIAKHRKVKL